MRRENDGNGFYSLFLSEKEKADTLIKTEFEKLEKDSYPGLFRAMEYALFPGGKRVRPVVLKWCAELGSPDPVKVSKAAAAVEYIHAYSLVHDDLPSMDDDDSRRGKPTVHIAFGEAMAVLAGDALLTEAFALLGETGDPRMVSVLACEAGARGMVGGQAADILAREDIRYINELKTARLFRGAAVMGGLAGGADDPSLDKLSGYGINLGKAFQLRDDLLDDEAPDLSAARAEAEEYVARAKEAVSGFSGSGRLTELADFMVERKQ